MARILCAKSSIEFKVEHFPCYLTAREVSHPVFSISTPELLTYSERVLEDTISATDKYLLYLALFNSTGLMRFEYPAIQTDRTQSIIAQNIDRLFEVVGDIHTIGADRLRLPQFNIGPETKTLDNSKYWIQVWETEIKHYSNSYRMLSAVEKLGLREVQLEKLIRDKSKDINSYSAKLANWAYDAGNFEEYADWQIVDENGYTVWLHDYWKKIIVACATKDKIYGIKEEYLTNEVNPTWAVLQHCEYHIDHGSVLAHTLMSLLREGLNKKESLEKALNSDIGFVILPDEGSIEYNNILASVESAPIREPARFEYASEILYIRASIKWKRKQEYEAQVRIQQEINAIAKINSTGE